MASRFLATGILASVCAAAAFGAHAADAKRNTFDHPPNYYDKGYKPGDAAPGSIKEGYPVPEGPPVKPQASVEPPVAKAKVSCLSPADVRKKLKLEGWSDFKDIELDPDAALVSAKRQNGETYDLRVDRCTGEVVNARIVGPKRPNRDYAAMRPNDDEPEFDTIDAAPPHRFDAHPGLFGPRDYYDDDFDDRPRYRRRFFRWDRF